MLLRETFDLRSGASKEVGSKSSNEGHHMETLEEISLPDYERVLLCQDSSIGYRSLIAIHNTNLGPAVGGTRVWPYQSDEQALNDVLRLARGMTYKNALAGLDLGGGKSVIISNNRISNRQEFFATHGRFVERLGGRYITAEDVGTSPADMEYVSRETQYVAGLLKGGGDPSPFTARGVFRGMQAAAQYRWNSSDLSDKTIALQGCGNVGYHLAGELAEAGAKLIVTDTDQARASRLIEAYGGAEFVEADEIYGTKAEIFAPCALGGVINHQTIPLLKCEIIAGAANNQLLSDSDGDELKRRGLLYAPDYAINAGGIISGAFDLLGWEAAQVKEGVEGIFETLLSIFSLARELDVSPHRAADQLAERRFLHPLASGSFQEKENV